MVFNEGGDVTRFNFIGKDLAMIQCLSSLCSRDVMKGAQVRLCLTSVDGVNRIVSNFLNPLWRCYHEDEAKLLDDNADAGRIDLCQLSAKLQRIN